MRKCSSFLVLAVVCGCHQAAGSAPAPDTTAPAAAVGGSSATGAAGLPQTAGRDSSPPAGAAGVVSTAGSGLGPTTKAGAAAVSGGSGSSSVAGATASAGTGATGAAAGAAAAGSEAASGNGGGAAGRAGAAGSQDTRPFSAIAFAGLVSAVELAPVRLAANGIYPARVTISSGGVDSLFSGGALVASNAETQALRASAQHPNLRIIFTICEGLYRIVAKRSAGIQTLADLRGKSISVPSGTSSNYFLVKMLALANLTEQDIVLVNGMPGAGRLTTDAATIWEPGIQYVVDALKDDVIEFQKDDQAREVYRELFNLHATAESLRDPEKRRSIVEFTRALITASQQIRSDPMPAWKLLTGPTGASQDVLERSWAYERYAGGLVGDLLDVLEQEETWRAKIDGRTARARGELAMLIDDSIVKEANGM